MKFLMPLFPQLKCVAKYPMRERLFPRLIHCNWVRIQPEIMIMLTFNKVFVSKSLLTTSATLLMSLIIFLALT